jgi:hypothetical protein
MILREDILSELEKELGDLLAAAPADLSESTLKDIKAESIGYAEHVLNALTTQELQSAGAFNRFAGARTDEDALAVKPMLPRRSECEKTITTLPQQCRR